MLLIAAGIVIWAMDGVAEMSWSRKFDDPIALPDGRTLVTLRDAESYITDRRP
jgi:hypothetical protein